MHPKTGKFTDFAYVALTPERQPDLSLVTCIPRLSAGDPQS